MQYGVLHNGDETPRRSKTTRRAIHFLPRVGGPSRFRSRTFMAILSLLGTFLLILGRQNYMEIERTAYALKTYIPSRITDVISQYGSEFQDTRWDDDDKSTGNIAYTKPKFHLLIPASIPTANLCKTLLSAAILNYPPPTLLGYGMGFESDLEVLNATYGFLMGREAGHDDLVLIVEEDAWFQLPAEVTINRFFHGMRDSSYQLLEKYGLVVDSNSTTQVSSPFPKFVSKVLFGAAKECSNPSGDPACISPPQSPLPEDIYGPQTDKHAQGKYNRPRFMGSTMAMGRVSDLRPIYQHAIDMLELGDGSQNSQNVFSQIFGEQEYVRSLTPESKSLSMSAKFRKLFTGGETKPKPENFAPEPNKNYEFSITLDYISSIFQIMNNSNEDVHMLSFDHPSIIASPSRISAAAFANPIHLPRDLNSTLAPFSQYIVSSLHPDPPITTLDDMPGAWEKNSWEEIELATNVIVPGASVPASLNFYGNEVLLSSMWSQMWYQKYARALMRQYIRSPAGPIAAEAAQEGGEKWWDLRGGKGGVWTDRGEWLDWNEVCGAFDSEVFGDGKGEFGYEDESIGGQKVEYKFGKVISGKVSKGKKPNVAPGGMKKANQRLGHGWRVKNKGINDQNIVNKNSDKNRGQKAKQGPQTQTEKIADEIRKVAAKLKGVDEAFLTSPSEDIAVIENASLGSNGGSTGQTPKTRLKNEYEAVEEPATVRADLNSDSGWGDQEQTMSLTSLPAVGDEEVKATQANVELYENNEVDQGGEYTEAGIIADEIRRVTAELKGVDEDGQGQTMLWTNLPAVGDDEVETTQANAELRENSEADQGQEYTETGMIADEIRKVAAELKAADKDGKKKSLPRNEIGAGREDQSHEEAMAS